MTMKRYIIVAVAAILASALTSSAQTAEPKFQRYNRWMVGGEFVQNSNGHLGAGATGIYGKQFSEVVFLGVGFGLDMYVYNEGEVSETTIYPDGSQVVEINPPYRYDFILPVYADLQVNLSRRRSPFFGELKFGAALDMYLNRIRGTYNSNKLEIWGGGVLLGAAAGKRFTLRNDDQLSVVLGVDCILWPWYMNVPVSLGIRYGF